MITGGNPNILGKEVILLAVREMRFGRPSGATNVEERALLCRPG
jgi:hypothetical protein